MNQFNSAKLFESDPNWAAFATKHDYIKTEPTSPVKLDIPSNRAGQAVSEQTWGSEHPLSSVGYTSFAANLRVRDGAEVNVKISYPLRAAGQAKLPVVFVTHGGGWIQGTHITEEAWLLWPLYEQFDLVVISVEYRLAPEHRFPTWVEDSWEILQQVLSAPTQFVSQFQSASAGGFALDIDPTRVILAGSSAGGGIAAVLSQKCRDQNVPIWGVILNVPVLCDYRHLPVDCVESYNQCTASFLSSGEMKAVWDLVIPSETAGSDPTVSPLLGSVAGLPRHIIFVAGQDPLREEGLAYAKKLEKDGAVDVQLHVYKGVPHTFAEFWELDATRRFWEDFRGSLTSWVHSTVQ